mgnify:CR=1 FL=1
MPKNKLTVDERLNDQSRRIRMLEDVFVPMAKAAMEILTGKQGQPGMAEDMRNVRADVEELIRGQREEKIDTLKIRKNGFERIERLENNQQTDKEIKLLGMKVTAETKIAIINGIFILISSLIAIWVSR